MPSWASPGEAAILTGDGHDRIGVVTNGGGLTDETCGYCERG